MVASRTWLALVAAPVVFSAVYASLGLASLPANVGSDRPSAMNFIVPGAIAGLLFEVIVVIPLYLGLRKWRRLSSTTFLITGTAAWLGLSFVLMLFVGVNANGASATAVQLLPPGIALVFTFWLLNGGARGA
jgi:hypothetical protein